jgi:hypothetical protein
LPEAIRRALGGQARLHSPKRKPPKRRVWLYRDPYPGTDSNVSLQFQHDAAKHDGVRRKYITRRGGIAHLLAYLRCEWIFTSEVSLAVVSPFTHKKIERLAERLFLRWRMVYLQGGVHQFAGGNELYAESGLAEKIVVSTPAEFECFRDKYGYRPEQLIPAGLARYDTLDRSAAPEGRVLFAPSWRNYLMYDGKPALERVLASGYYKNICAFLRDCDLELDFYLHPKFAGLWAFFSFNNPRVRNIYEAPVLTRYNACVTDISSIAYDFAYLGRYVQYFLPDVPQFRAGMHEYRVFDLPQIFGPHAETAGDALTQLREAALRGFAPEGAYKARMEGFFYPLEGGREKVYLAVKEK